MSGHLCLEAFPGGLDHGRNTLTPKFLLRCQSVPDEQSLMGQALHLQAPAYLPRAMVAAELHRAQPNKGLSMDPRSMSGLGGNQLVGGRGPCQHPTEWPVPTGGELQLPASLVLQAPVILGDCDESGATYR